MDAALQWRCVPFTASRATTVWQRHGGMALRASARLPCGLQSRAFNQTYKNLFKVFLELHKCLTGMGC